MPRFTIITPVYIHNQARLIKLERAIGSVANQTFKDFEMIVVNDGSPCPWTPPEYPWLKVLEQPHLERLIACNLAFGQAEGEIIVFLDSDDELASYHLECVNMMYEVCPQYKVFNFGSVHIYPDFSMRMRGPFKPAMLEEGHDFFGGGQIVNGTFVFKKECIGENVLFPHQTNPWDFSAKAQEEFPELKNLFTIVNEDNPNGVVKELGNPMGQDFYLFYKLTRKYHSKPIDVYLYTVHQKGERKVIWPET